LFIGGHKEKKSGRDCSRGGVGKQDKTQRGGHEPIGQKKKVLKWGKRK